MRSSSYQYGAGARRGQGDHRWWYSEEPSACGKRCYSSGRAAKLDNQNSRFRLGTYYCVDCKAHHVRNEDKR